MQRNLNFKYNEFRNTNNGFQSHYSRKFLKINKQISYNQVLELACAIQCTDGKILYCMKKFWICYKETFCCNLKDARNRTDQGKCDGVTLFLKGTSTPRALSVRKTSNWMRNFQNLVTKFVKAWKVNRIMVRLPLRSCFSLKKRYCIQKSVTFSFARTRAVALLLDKTTINQENTMTRYLASVWIFSVEKNQFELGI